MGREFTLNGSYELRKGSTHYSANTVEVIQFEDTVKYTGINQYNLESNEYIQLRDTAKKLCKTRTFISTSHKRFTKELHWNSYTFTCTVLTDSLT